MASSTSNMALLVLRQPTCVVYFNVVYLDQQTGAVHLICRQKMLFGKAVDSHATSPMVT